MKAPQVATEGLKGSGGFREESLLKLRRACLGCIFRHEEQGLLNVFKNDTFHTTLGSTIVSFTRSINF